MEKTYSRGLSLFFDNVRLSRGLTQEEFVFDIVSMRQYRRYLSGECKISQTVVRQFSERLGLKPEHIIMDYEASKVDETQLVIDFYNYAANYDYENANRMRKSINLNLLEERVNRIFYEHTCAFLDYQTKKITEFEFIQKNIELVNYPEILNYYKISGIELVIMGSLLNHVGFKDREMLADKIKSILMNPKIIIGGYIQSHKFLCVQMVARYYGINGEFQKVIDLCEHAIKQLKKIRLYYMFDYCYYYISLAYDALGNIPARDEAIFRCYSVIMAENNPAKLKKFTDLIEADYKINLKSYMLDYISKNT